MCVASQSRTTEAVNIIDVYVFVTFKKNTDDKLYNMVKSNVQ